MQLYAIYDRKMKMFQQQVVAEVNKLAYLRNIADGVKQAEGSLINKHPEDFDIMVLGELNMETGIIEPLMPPALVENIAVLMQAATAPLKAVAD